MSQPFALLSYFVLVSAGVVSRPNISEVVEACCPTDLLGCCEETINFRQPFNCSISENVNHRAISCIEKLLFKHHEEPSIDDLPCCEVFEHDQNESDCFSTCTTTLRSPSLKQKSEAIKKCAVNNPLFGCFTRCQDRRARGQPITMPRHFSKFCTFDLLLQPGQTYSKLRPVK